MKQLLIFIALGFGIRLLIAPIAFQTFHVPRIFRFKRRAKQFSDVELIMFLSQFRQTLVSGQPISQAIASVTSGFSDINFENTAEAARSGRVVLSAFEADVRKLENPTLLQLVRIINFNQDLGSSLNQPIEYLIETVKARQKRTDLIDSELAGVRATVVVLAMLPLLGIALGTLMGVNLISWLLFEPFGRWLLLGASSLELVGILWVKQLIRTHK
ncbi:MAG: hypothetical protein KGQ38_06815 [Actinomycetales bacterium]|nr:hypothetical protein [Actinomycetales bacterium]